MYRFTLACLYLLLPLPLLACTDDGGAAEQSGTGDGDGDATTTGDGDGDPGDGDGDPGDGDGDGDPGDGDGDGDGDPSTGDGDGDPTVGACGGVDECVLVNDCCSCEVLPAGQEPPPCDIEACLISTCESQLAGFVPKPACRVGTCTFAALNCQISASICEVEPPPPCEGGLVQSVINDCYGPCVPPNMCANLPGQCDASSCGEGFACMVTQSGAPSQCIPLPPACEGSPSCECIAPWWTEIDCGGACGTTGSGFLCEDGG
jgi:hypothetical protein